MYYHYTIIAKPPFTKPPLWTPECNEWRNTIGILIEICWLEKAFLRAAIYWYVHDKQRGTVSSQSRLQTAQFQQYSANLSCKGVGVGSILGTSW